MKKESELKLDPCFPCPTHQSKSSLHVREGTVVLEKVEPIYCWCEVCNHPATREGCPNCMAKTITELRDLIGGWVQKVRRIL